MGVIDRLTAAYKSLRFPAPTPPNIVSVFPTWADFDQAVNQLLIGFKGTQRDYATAVGDLTMSSLMMAAVTAVGSSASEAELQVREQRGNEEVVVDDHEMVKLWYRPNPFYDSATMMKAVSTSWVITDNAYILKERNDEGRVKELWYEPHNTIRAAYPSDGSEFISHYEVQRGPDWLPRPVTDVIHFRNGLDPANPRYGLASTPAIFRELFGDNASANWYANLMENDAGFRYFLSIDNKAGELGQEDIENIKKLLMAQITGDKKFTPPIITNAEPKKLQFSPEELDLRLQRYLAEERFCAVKNIPGVVMELGSAGEHSIYNNVSEGQQRFTNNYLVPYWKHIAETLTHGLLRDFDDNPDHYAFFDTSEVKALKEDENAMHKRVNGDYLAGIITRAEARRAISLDATDADKVYFVPKGGATQAMDAEPPKDAAAPSTTTAKEKTPTNGALTPADLMQ